MERLTCPQCGNTYASLGGLKTHMERKHDGYTEDEIAAALHPPASGEPISQEPERQPTDGTPQGSEAPLPSYEQPSFTQPPPSQPQVEEPKRISKRSRDLNDKFNEALQLILKHLTKGLDENEKAQLDYNRREVFAACMGVEFDFEERLVTLKSRMWLFVGLGVLWLGEQLPGAGALLAQLREKGKSGGTA